MMTGLSRVLLMVPSSRPSSLLGEQQKDEIRLQIQQTGLSGRLTRLSTGGRMSRLSHAVVSGNFGVCGRGVVVH
jgi:hypothetical protein